MLQLFSLRVHIFLILIIFALICLPCYGLEILRGGEINYWRLFSLSFSLTVSIIILLKNTRVLFNLWHKEKWGIGKKLSGWVGPDLEGRYDAVFESNYKQRQNPDNGESSLSLPSQARPVYINMR